MIKSMTGFAAKELKLRGSGKISVELRSTNHKFLDTVLHLPEGFLSLEDGIKKMIEARIKRGRVTCVVNIAGEKPAEILLNTQLLKKYIAQLSRARRRFGMKEEITLDTLIHLPGVLSLAQAPVSAKVSWPRLKILVNSAVQALDRARQKEGSALYRYLNSRARSLEADLRNVKARFKKVVADRLNIIKTDEEKASFLKNTDVTE
jgi:uncharacterized protein (TIGR00255 family)